MVSPFIAVHLTISEFWQATKKLLFNGLVYTFGWTLEETIAIVTFLFADIIILTERCLEGLLTNTWMPFNGTRSSNIAIAWDWLSTVNDRGTAGKLILGHTFLHLDWRVRRIFVVTAWFRVRETILILGDTNRWWWSWIAASTTVLRELIIGGKLDKCFPFLLLRGRFRWPLKYIQAIFQVNILSLLFKDIIIIEVSHCWHHLLISIDDVTVLQYVSLHLLCWFLALKLLNPAICITHQLIDLLLLIHLLFFWRVDVLVELLTKLDHLILLLLMDFSVRYAACLELSHFFSADFLLFSSEILD